MFGNPMTHMMTLLCSSRRIGRGCKDLFVKVFVSQARSMDKEMEHPVRRIVRDKSLAPSGRMARDECVTTRAQRLQPG